MKNVKNKFSFFVGLFLLFFAGTRLIQGDIGRAAFNFALGAGNLAIFYYENKKEREIRERNTNIERT